MMIRTGLIALSLLLAGCADGPFINIDMGGDAEPIACPEYVSMPAPVKAWVAERRKAKMAGQAEIEAWGRWLADDVQGLLTGPDCD